MTGVYLIHFDRPLAHARHYLGWASDIDARFADHSAGKGARLLQVLREQNISFQIVRVWRNAPRSFEARLKKRQYNCRLCPVCNPKKARTCGIRALEIEKRVV